MICPHDNAECFSVKCDANKSCIYPVNSPPKPTMKEIERLVDAMMQAFEDVHTYGAPADIARYKAPRAALMAAIRLHGESEYQRGYEVCDACWQVDA